jgi:hypothetical protein
VREDYIQHNPDVPNGRPLDGGHAGRPPRRRTSARTTASLCSSSRAP